MRIKLAVSPHEYKQSCQSCQHRPRQSFRRPPLYPLNEIIHPTYYRMITACYVHLIANELQNGPYIEVSAARLPPCDHPPPP